MRRIALALSMILLVAFGATACGSSSDNDTATNNGGTPAQTMPGSTTTGAAFACPSDNTKAFAKTRFVGDLGIIFGTFHHFIYNPYKDGAFKQSGVKKVLAFGKAAAAAAVVAKFSSNAVDNVTASPLLCNAIGSPLSKANDLIQGLGGKLKKGDISSILSIQGLVASITGLMAKNGSPITESVQNP